MSPMQSNYPWLTDYLLSKAGAVEDYKAEWDWMRYLVGGKMFAAVCLDKDKRPIVTLKCEPDFGEYVRGLCPDVFPGYYMHKLHWNSVLLEGSLPEELLKEMIDRSYSLIYNSLPPKERDAVNSSL